MSGFAGACCAYDDAKAPTRTARSIEYQAFANVTQKLAKSVGEGFENFPRLAEAIYENRKLWLLLAENVAHKDNLLPPQLRAQIFYLAEYIEKHSGEVLNREGDVSVLVDINTMIMRGLRSEAGAA